MSRNKRCLYENFEVDIVQCSGDLSCLSAVSCPEFSPREVLKREPFWRVFGPVAPRCPCSIVSTLKIVVYSTRVGILGTE